MITCIQGTPGSGKSSVIVADMADFLLTGGVVATNFNLHPDWLDMLCKSSFRYRWNLVDRDLFRRSLWSRCYRIGTPDTLYTLSASLKAALPPGSRVKEGMGRLYLDEAQLLLNSRDWQKNKQYIEFFTQHRKFGWDVSLVAHSISMIDKQVRALVEVESRMRNLQKCKILGLIPMSWFPLFVVINRYAGIAAGAGEILSRRIYSLSKAYRNIYDTMEVFAFDASNVAVTQHGPYIPPQTALAGRPAASLGRVRSEPKKVSVYAVELPYYARVVPSTRGVSGWGRKHA